MALTCRGARGPHRDVNGQEPAFTNNAKIKEQDPFIETLDYIFYR
jgi:hypothetical protein